MPINTKEELKHLSQTMKRDVLLHTKNRSMFVTVDSLTISTAKHLLQRSTNEYSLIIPNTEIGMQVDNGIWIPTLVFLPFKDS